MYHPCETVERCAAGTCEPAARPHTDHVRNDDTRDKHKVENTTERRRKARLRWFGHVKWRDGWTVSISQARRFVVIEGGMEWRIGV